VVADDDFDAFFRASYAPLVRALAVVAADAQVAEDVVQDAFVQALRHWPKVRGYDRPEAWVRRVALNKLADRGRRHRRRDRAVERMGRARPPADEPSDLDLAAAIAALPEQQRRVVGLFYLLDLPVAEVADDLGVAPGTVKSHLAAARKTLSTVLEVVDD
jgi:RNA polymerase sigma-70 factor (ECF subfamily)